MKKILKLISFFCYPIVILSCGDVAVDKKNNSRTDAPAQELLSPLDNSVKNWCDVSYTKDSSPDFVFPQTYSSLSKEDISSLPKNKWIWLNVWATWCQPCQKEMPMIQSWIKNINTSSKEEILFWTMSIDDNTDVVKEYIGKHAEIDLKNALYVPSTNLVVSWLKKLGLADMGAIPVHVFVSPEGKVRCIKAGIVSESDYGIIKILTQN